MGRFTDAVEVEIAATHQGMPCGVKALLEGLSRNDRAEVEALLTGPAQHAQLARAFKKLGFSVTADTISRHRRNLCSCGSR